MGLAQSGTIIRDGDNLKVQGVKPAGIAVQGEVCYRGAAQQEWLLLAHTSRAIVSSNTLVTSGIDTTGANLLIVVVGTYSANTMSDSENNNWLLVANPSIGTNLAVFYCANPTVSSNHTVTVHNAGAQISCSVAAFSGASSIPLDQVNSATGTIAVNSIQPGSITPTINNALVITASATAGITGAISAVDSSFTMIENTPYSSPNYLNAVAYLIQETAGPLNPTWNITSVYAGMAAMIASFKPA